MLVLCSWAVVVLNSGRIKTNLQDASHEWRIQLEVFHVRPTNKKTKIVFTMRRKLVSTIVVMPAIKVVSLYIYVYIYLFIFSFRSRARIINFTIWEWEKSGRGDSRNGPGTCCYAKYNQSFNLPRQVPEFFTRDVFFYEVTRRSDGQSRANNLETWNHGEDTCRNN